MIRYKSKDKGKLIPYKRREGLRIQKIYLPPFNSPHALIYGRGEFIEFHNKKGFPQLIQEGLFSDVEVASSTTENFRLINNDEVLAIHVQLKSGVTINDRLQNKYSTAISNHIHFEIPITFYLYQNFPFGMGLDYERKFKHI